eukprot:m.334172 g.334172  ORF g.334172 m.334172 type:complete len:80 (+) comp20505_c0_seq36:1923-2162(+)
MEEPSGPVFPVNLVDTQKYSDTYSYKDIDILLVSMHIYEYYDEDEIIIVEHLTKMLIIDDVHAGLELVNVLYYMIMIEC